MRLLVLRLAWCTLPLSAGPALGDAVSAWEQAPRICATALAWVLWAAGVLAVLAPRPLGLTSLRAVAFGFVVTAAVVATTGSAGDLEVSGALAATVVTAGLAGGRSIARAAAQGAAYGDERRYPLRVPPALYLGPIPLARAAVVASVVCGPLLLADGRVLAGGLALAAGAALGPVALRALHTLSRRWVVLVPAGLVVADPLTLADPVLFPREHVHGLAAAPPGAIHEDAVDLRLGAGAGSVMVVLDRDAQLVRVAGWRRSVTARARSLVVALSDRDALLTEALTRRLPAGAPAQAATPPPTTASPS